MPMSKLWKPVLQGDLAEHARQVAMEVAQRCSSEANIQQALAAEHTEDLTRLLRWRSSSVVGGDAGIALLSASMNVCFPNNEWDVKAHAFLSRAVKAYNPRQPNPSLFTGATGLAFVATQASQDGKYYTALRAGLDEHISRLMPGFLARAQHQSSFSIWTYDLISGAVGIAAYLILRGQYTSKVNMDGYCRDVLSYLVTLTKPNSKGYYCFISPENVVTEEKQERYPAGYTDCGLAHGVAGIIGVLALAIRKGWEVPGIRDGLAALAQWLAEQQVSDEYGINWPVSIEPATVSGQQPIVGSRASWCYGIPGVARALYLAGQALDDEKLRRTALSAFDSLMARPRDDWGIWSPNFCHGLSGMMQSCLRMYHDTGYERLLPFIHKLSEELLSMYDSSTLFGFQDRRYAHEDAYDNPLLLEGAPGVALTLLALSQPTLPSWDQFFLLS
jgi:lantibiotic modifying enzyme